MPRMVSRMVRWMSSSACVVTSPITTHSPFVIAVSHATRACGSCPSMPSSTASETWSQILSGCPSVTDSEVSRYEVDVLKEVATTTAHHIEMGNLDRHYPPGTGIVSALMRGGALALAVLIAIGCDGPGSGRSLPSGTHWIHYALVSFAGPVSRNQGVLATTSLSTIRADVLGTANTTSTGTPWADASQKSGVLYVAEIGRASCRERVEIGWVAESVMRRR